MIGFLSGTILDRTEDGLLLDVSGVGYELTCSSNTLGDFAMAPEARVWVHTAVREDAITLFGFSTQLEKRLFLSLLKVNGIGPKMASRILSGASLDQITSMIESGDVKGLSGLPKVGKKTAEQLVLTLRGKLVMEPEQTKPGAKSKSASPLARFSGVRGEVLSALVNLGFRLQDAEKVVGDLPEEIDVQNGVRQGLQALSGGF
ncbi:MAG: Holliday junction branch migration protein RuvA [Bdellovibrionota bacterium]